MKLAQALCGPIPAYKILLTVAIAAIAAISLDGLIESGFLGWFLGREPQVANSMVSFYQGLHSNNSVDPKTKKVPAQYIEVCGCEEPCDLVIFLCLTVC
jgi:hypothetical protein